MNLQCPILDNSSFADCVTIGHGGGGLLTSQLIDKVFHPHFSNVYLDAALDGAVIPAQRGNLAVSTDTFVVSPLFFRGGNIGDLAVNGSVNDVLCCGASPRFITAGFVIEEGFPIASLEEIAKTMQAAAKIAGVKIVTADTKVVERGKCDGIYINTTAFGWIIYGVNLAPKNIRVGDSVIITGPIGNHGIAIMSERNGIEFSTPIRSDTAALVDIAQNLFVHVPQIHEMRDPTRGGLSSTLNEIASTGGITISITDADIPIEPEVQSACDMLGLDPLYVANEGIMLVFVPHSDTEQALDVIHNSKHGSKARVIGSVTERSTGKVILEMPFGQKRLILPFSGEQLPRIC